MAEAAAVVASPCTNVCTIDARSGWCIGCRRTLAEIAAWSTLDDRQKLAVRDALAQRRIEKKSNDSAA